MDSLQSPVKGLEKLAQELRHERQKSTSALQDRSRQKIEIEKLKTQLADAQFELEGKVADYERLYRDFGSVTTTIGDYEERQTECDSVISALRKQIETHDQERREEAEAYAELKTECDQLRQAESVFAQTVSKLENAVMSRTDVIEEMEREVKRLQSMLSQQDHRISELSLDLAEKHHLDDETQARLQKTDVLADNYREMQASTQHLRSELDEALARSAELSTKLREAQNQNRCGEGQNMTLSAPMPMDMAHAFWNTLI